MPLNILIVTNLVIGISFLSVPIAAGWLYFHRHRDWPKAWVLLVVGVTIGLCSISRIVHAITYYYWSSMPVEVMAFSDSLTAMAGMLAAALVPWAVWGIKQAPTPDDYQRLMNKAAITAVVEANAKWSNEEKDKAERRLMAMKAMLSDYANIDPELKSRMFKIVEEV